MIKNNFNNVVVFGCSHIFGTDLLDCNSFNPSKFTWPNLIFGSENVTNYAKAGASCDTVLRRLLLLLNNNLPSAIIIQWPDFLRWEFIDKDFLYCGKDFPYQTNKEFDSFTYNKTSEKKYKTITASIDFVEILKNSLKSILVANSIIKSLKIPVVNLYVSDIPEIDYPNHYFVENIIEPPNIWSEYYKSAVLKKNKNVYQLPDSDINVHDGNPDGDMYINTLLNKITEFPTENFEGKSWLAWCEYEAFKRRNKSIAHKYRSNYRTSGHFAEDAHATAAKILNKNIIDNIEKQIQEQTV